MPVRCHDVTTVLDGSLVCLVEKSYICYLGLNIKYKNLAIANRSRVSCAHNMLRALIGLNIRL